MSKKKTSDALKMLNDLVGDDPKRHLEIEQEIMNSKTSRTVYLARLDKLAKWVKDLIESLNRKIADRDKLLAVDRGVPTRVRVNDYGFLGEPELYLPEDSKVEFHLGDKDDPGFDYRNVISVKLITSAEGDRVIEVRGGEAIDVQPQVSNSLIIKMRDRNPGVWLDQETAEHYVAESMDALDRWKIVSVAPHKPGVLKVLAIRPPTGFQSDAQCHIVYVKAGSNDA